MKRLGQRLGELAKENSGPIHPLAMTAFGLAFVFPLIGFPMAFIARTQIAFSQEKFSGDRLALAAIIVAPIAQFSTLIFAAVWTLGTVAINGAN